MIKPLLSILGLFFVLLMISFGAALFIIIWEDKHK